MKIRKAEGSICHVLVKESWAKAVNVHTGWHYDLNMSDVFPQDLGHLPEPHIHLWAADCTPNRPDGWGHPMLTCEKGALDKKRQGHF